MTNQLHIWYVYKAFVTLYTLLTYRSFGTSSELSIYYFFLWYIAHYISLSTFPQYPIFQCDTWSLQHNIWTFSTKFDLWRTNPLAWYPFFDIILLFTTFDSLASMFVPSVVQIYDRNIFYIIYLKSILVS